MMKKGVRSKSSIVLVLSLLSTRVSGSVCFWEMLVAAVILRIIESPENTVAADGELDLVEGKVASLFDAFYWTFPTFTCYVDKSQKPFWGKVVMMAQGFYMF